MVQLEPLIDASTVSVPAVRRPRPGTVTRTALTGHIAPALRRDQRRCRNRFRMWDARRRNSLARANG